MARAALFGFLQRPSGGPTDLYAHAVGAAGADYWASAGGTLVSSTTDSSTEVISVSDGEEGIILVWGTGTDIYAQRFNSSGSAQWTAGGVVVCNASGTQSDLSACSDDDGGVIVAWSDGRGANSDIYAQRISSAGVAQWTANGVSICSATGNQTSTTICPDGSGGAYLAWVDFRASAVNSHIYGQRINSSGAEQNAANGVAIATSGVPLVTPYLSADGSGNAFITYKATSSVPTQKINPSIVTQWSGSGPTTGGSTGQLPTNMADGMGGVFVAARSSTSPQARWSHFNSAGTAIAQNQTLGYVDGNATGLTKVAICPDGTGGAFFSWRWYNGAASKYVIVGSHVGPAATFAVQVTTSLQAAISNTALVYGPPATVADGDGGFIVFWYGGAAVGGINLYVQKFASNRTSQWTAFGVTVKSNAIVDSQIDSAASAQLGPTIVDVVIPPPAAPDSRAGLENNIRLLIDDRDKDHYAISSVRMVQLMNGAMHTLANRVFMEDEAIATVTLVAGTYDYTLTGIVGAVRGAFLSTYGMELEPMEWDQMAVLYRQDTAAPSNSGVPAYYALVETSGQASKIRVAPTPNSIGAVPLKVRYSVIPSALTLETSTVPFSEPLLRAFERMVANQCLAVMHPHDRERRMLGVEQMKEWAKYVDDVVREENWRMRVASGATQPDVAWTEV